MLLQTAGPCPQPIAKGVAPESSDGGGEGRTSEKRRSWSYRAVIRRDVVNKVRVFLCRVRPSAIIGCFCRAETTASAEAVESEGDNNPLQFSATMRVSNDPG